MQSVPPRAPAWPVQLLFGGAIVGRVGGNPGRPFPRVLFARPSARAYAVRSRALFARPSAGEHAVRWRACDYRGVSEQRRRERDVVRSAGAPAWLISDRPQRAGTRQCLWRRQCQWWPGPTVPAGVVRRSLRSRGCCSQVPSLPRVLFAGPSARAGVVRRSLRSRGCCSQVPSLARVLFAGPSARAGVVRRSLRSRACCSLARMRLPRRERITMARANNDGASEQRRRERTTTARANNDRVWGFDTVAARPAQPAELGHPPRESMGGCRSPPGRRPSTP